MKPARSQGLTLVELLTVVAVLGIVLAIATPTFTDLINKQRVRQAAAELSTDLAYARAEAGLRNDRVALKFNRNNGMSCYTVAVMGGAFGNCDCTRTRGSACTINLIELKTTQLASLRGVGLVISDSITGANHALEFQPPHMTVVPDAAAITVEGSRGYKLRVLLSPLGRVSTCSPDGLIGGVQPCP
jgi:type IV fimbrial biogenesis protein FimT